MLWDYPSIATFIQKFRGIQGQTEMRIDGNGFKGGLEQIAVGWPEGRIIDDPFRESCQYWDEEEDEEDEEGRTHIYGCCFFETI